MIDDIADIAPRRIASIRRWLNLANGRLLSMQRHQSDLLEAARSLGVKPKSKPRPRLVARLAKAG